MRRGERGGRDTNLNLKSNKGSATSFETFDFSLGFIKYIYETFGSFGHLQLQNWENFKWGENNPLLKSKKGCFRTFWQQ